MRLFASLFKRAERPVSAPMQVIRHTMAGETPTDRLERLYVDAGELVRRIYSGKPYSRREMQAVGMGGRRWAAAYWMLIHAGVLNQAGLPVMKEGLHARRALYACREHYLLKLKENPGYVLPF